MANKKTLGEHIEQGLTNLANRGYQIQQSNREWQEENISLGLIPDHDKLRMLKAELYRKVRAGGDVTDLASAIATLENSIHREFQRKNTLEAVTARFITSLFVISIASVTLSIPVTYACGHSQSNLCRNSRGLTDWFISEFQEPQSVKVPRTIPANINP